MESKGIHAFRITWVKGHAKQIHIDQGVTNETNKEGNDKADETADIGSSLHGENLMQATNWLHRRHRDHLVFMKNVSHHIIEAYQIHRLLLQEDEDHTDAAKISNGIMYEALKYEDSDHARYLQPTASMKNDQQFCNKSNQACNMELFTTNLQTGKPGDHCRYVTWLELYILYRLRGAPKPIDD